MGKGKRGRHGPALLVQPVTAERRAAFSLPRAEPDGAPFRPIRPPAHLPDTSGADRIAIVPVSAFQGRVSPQPRRAGFTLPWPPPAMQKLLIECTFDRLRSSMPPLDAAFSKAAGWDDDLRIKSGSYRQTLRFRHPRSCTHSARTLQIIRTCRLQNCHRHPASAPAERDERFMDVIKPRRACSTLKS